MRFKILFLGWGLFFAKGALSQQLKTLEQVWEEKKIEAKEYAESNNLIIRKFFSDGTIMEIQYLDESGKPLYYKTGNAEASFTTGTNKLYEGASLGLSLSGKGINIGVWDGGLIRATHNEFEGRATIVEGSELSLHATHVTGTILAKGLNALAKGMAFEATSVNYDGLNGDNAEMMSEAQNGLILSNHSYGAVLGWNFNSSNGSWQWFGNSSISSQEDYRFGYYSVAAATWDNIAYNNADYLIVKSAGNDRNDVGNGIGAPPDGPYDIIGQQGIAKNILTVGSANALTGDYTGPSDVSLAPYSSWGPADDGRIKPDIVGMGQGLLSTSSTGDDQYATLSGTSMAAPNVTGSIALLQQLYFQLHNKHLSSAGLKALVIHSAYETGINDGPDYQYGWGLLNMERASKQLILDGRNNNFVKEGIINQDDTIEYILNLQGNDKVVATLVWNDPPGEPETIAALDPPALKLINDLDIRLIDENGVEYLPWAINPETKQALKSDNFRDNVEKLELSAPFTGVYNLRVTHKGNLGNESQKYSLVVSNEDFSQKLRPFYFLGTSTDLTNPNNWSNQSGGMSIGEIPTSEDIIIFDDNSIGTLPENKIILTSNLACFSLAASGNLAFDLDLNGHKLKIEGALTIKNNLFTISNGIVAITSKNNIGNIEVVGNNLLSSGLELLTNSKPVSLLSQLNVKNIIVENSNFNSNGFHINTGEVVIVNSQVDFSNSVINGLNRYIISDTLSVIKMDLLKIIFNGNSPVKELTGAMNEFSIVENVSNILKVRQVNLVDSLINDARVELFDSLIARTVWLNTGASLTIGNGQELNILESFHIEINLASPTVISSFPNGLLENPNIRSEFKTKFCFTNLSVQNVNALGNTKFVVDSNSILTNSQGWIQEKCEDVLSAEFDMEFSCVGGLSIFTDTSDGLPISWEWDFGDNTQLSIIQNPTHSYAEEGLYVIKLKVNDGLTQSVITKTVEIFERTLGIPSILLESNQLRSTAFAPNYQWYFDNTMLEGETDFFLTSFFETGNYSIQIWNNDCRLVSAPLLITGLKSAKNKLKVTPNPFYNEIRIKNTENKNVEIFIIDAMGKMRSLNVEKVDKEIIINTSKFGIGIYLLIVIMGEETDVLRVVKVK